MRVIIDKISKINEHNNNINPFVIMSNEYAQCLLYLDSNKYNKYFFSFEYFEDEVKISISDGVIILIYMLENLLFKIKNANVLELNQLKKESWFHELTEILEKLKELKIT
jgi:hypothetical protein